MSARWQCTSRDCVILNFRKPSTIAKHLRHSDPSMEQVEKSEDDLALMPVPRRRTSHSKDAASWSS